MFVPEWVYEKEHPGFSQLPDKKKKALRQKTKNKISAQISRDQAKAHLQSLEDKIELLTSQNKQNSEKMVKITKENQVLKCKLEM